MRRVIGPTAVRACRWNLQRWLYLAIVLDLRSRRVIGWAMRHTLEWELAGDALVMALGQRQFARTRAVRCSGTSRCGTIVADGIRRWGILVP